MPTANVSVKFPIELDAEIERVVDETGIYTSKSEFIKEACRRHLRGLADDPAITMLRAEQLLAETDPTGSAHMHIGGDLSDLVVNASRNITDQAKADSVAEAGPHRQAAAAFVDRVTDQVGNSVEALFLFGSVAAGTAAADSDVDILAVISDDADLAAVDDELLDIAFDVQLEYDVPVEVHTLGTSAFERRRERGEPFIRTVIETGERYA